MLTSVVNTMGLLPFNFAGVVDLPHRLVGLVYGVDERQAHMACFAFELGQDGVAKGFGGDAGAVGDEEDGAVGHGGFGVQDTANVI